MTTNVQEIKSITVSTFGKPKAEDYNTVTMTVSGCATEIFTISTKYGENKGVKGDFAAINSKTGEIVTSNAAFLPKDLIAKIESQLQNNNEVDFSADIKILETDKNDKGYTYIAEAPMTEARASKKSSILKSMLGVQKQLLLTK